MTDLAAISGTFADLKTVKTRGVLQMVIEVPIEHGAAVVEAFGFPQPGAEIPVAVARLVTPVTNRGGEKAEETAEPLAQQGIPGGGEPPAERRKWSELPFSQRAAMLCQEKDARGNSLAAAFFRERFNHYWIRSPGVNDTARADACLKMMLGIKSKRELDEDHDAASEFDGIARHMRRWRNEEAPAD